MWVKSKQTEGYNGVRTVDIIIIQINSKRAPVEEWWEHATSFPKVGGSNTSSGNEIHWLECEMASRKGKLRGIHSKGIVDRAGFSRFLHKFRLKFKYLFPESWPHQDLLSRNLQGLAMRMFQPWRGFHPICEMASRKGKLRGIHSKGTVDKAGFSKTFNTKISGTCLFVSRVWLWCACCLKNQIQINSFHFIKVIKFWMYKTIVSGSLHEVLY